MIPKPEKETEFGNLSQPGTIIWSYTGVVYMTTLGWKRRKYSGRGWCLAVRNFNGSIGWPRRSMIKKRQRLRNDQWHNIWQIG